MKWKAILILVNIFVAMIWIPAGIVRLLGGKKEPPAPLQSSFQPPPPSPSLPEPPKVEPAPQPTSPPQSLPVEKKEEPKEEEPKKKEKKEKESSPKKEEKKEKSAAKEEAKEKEPKEKTEGKEELPLGHFGISCTKGGCVLFDLKSGRRLRAGDTVDGWTVKEVNLSFAILEKEGKRTVLRVE